MDHEPVAGDRAILSLSEEQLQVGKRRRETLVRVARSTLTDQHTVDEPLSHERVTVEHVAIGQVVETAPPVRQEGDTTIFPILEEVVVVQRRLVLKEEVRVTRTRTTTRHVEQVSLRHQQATVTRLAADAEPDSGTHRAGEYPATSKGTSTMDYDTIVAVYDTPAHAELAVADLEQAGIPAADISTHASTSATGVTTGAPVREEGFWSSLFGGQSDHDSAVFDRSLDAGATVVTVKTDEAHAETVMSILETHQPVDIDERGKGYGLTQTVSPMATETAIPVAAPAVAPAAYAATSTSTAAAPLTDAGTLQLSEESIAVGKRVVNRGGTRIRRYVVEKPVEESINLHSETVTLDRRPVTDGRPVTAADFTDKVIEMTETAEEAVVSKTARVVEEVSLHKQVADRVETVRDTVRKEEVEIEKIPGDATTVTDTTTTRTI